MEKEVLYKPRFWGWACSAGGKVIKLVCHCVIAGTDDTHYWSSVFVALRWTSWTFHKEHDDDHTPGNGVLTPRRGEDNTERRTVKKGNDMETFARLRESHTSSAESLRLLVAWSYFLADHLSCLIPEGSWALWINRKHDNSVLGKLQMSQYYDRFLVGMVKHLQALLLLHLSRWSTWTLWSNVHV